MAADPLEAEVLAEVGRLVRELQPSRKVRVELDSALQSDLGLDSLARGELLRRLERLGGPERAGQTTERRLPSELLATAETPRDLLRALAGGQGGEPLAAGAGRSAPHEEGSGEPGPAEAAPGSTRTLLEVLAWHAGRHPGRRHILFYGGDEAAAEAEALTYGALARRARRIASGLAGAGVAPRQAVALMLPSGLDYFAAFLGIQMAGGVPVPLYPPARLSQVEDHLRRQAAILETAQAVALVTFPEVLPLARLVRGQVASLRSLTTVGELSRNSQDGGGGSERPGQARSEHSGAARSDQNGEARSEKDGGAISGHDEGFAAGEDDIAFLQFTSGSTGQPKGVTLSHRNLLANLRAIGRGVEIGPQDAVVSWLPLYHDMGLIGSWMASLYYGMPLYLMSPLTFLARPVRWLRAISRHRATLSAAPNFAYELCARKVSEEESEGLDLSSWRFALNGAEPVSPEAVRRFSERFSRHGFRPEAMAPVYGLAECSLAVAFPPLGRGPRIDAVAREAFARGGHAVAASPGDPHALRFAGCGFPLAGHEVRVVDAAGHELGARQEGELQFRGPSATSGYFRNSEATRRLQRGDGWLDSGDRAYLAEDGELFVTGRVKDIVIRAGRNIHPQELEEQVGEIAGVRKGCVVVFGVPDEAAGTERLVIAAETREREAAVRERLREAIQAIASSLLGAPADEVVLAPVHTVPKTSSGKVRRAASRELYLAQRLGRSAGSFQWQVVRLAAAGLRARLSRRTRAAGGVLYSACAWLAVALAVPPLWPALALLPGLPRRRRLARWTARLLLGAGGIPVRLEVEGGQETGAGLQRRPCLIASNHASYADGFLLTAALPPGFGYVVKRELERSFFSRIVLRRLGAIFVERFDAVAGAAEPDRMAAALAGGDSLVVFPEGTFWRTPGLRPFRLGAFVAAARTGTPVVPVAIRGSRSVLRGDELHWRRGAVTIAAGQPVPPTGTDWAAAVRLRDAVRAEILRLSGEPDAAES